VNDDLAQLADDYWQAILDEEPTERHMLGDYTDVGSYEEVSREADDRYATTLRDFASRAEGVDTASLDPEEVLTRGVIVSSATAHADLLETPLRCRNADPVHGLQGTLGLLMGLLAVPDQAVADAMPAKLDAVGTHFRQLAERTREARRPAGCRPRSPSRRRSSRSRRRSPHPSPTTPWSRRSGSPTESTPTPRVLP